MDKEITATKHEWVVNFVFGLVFLSFSLGGFVSGAVYDLGLYWYMLCGFFVIPMLFAFFFAGAEHERYKKAKVPEHHNKTSEDTGFYPPKETTKGLDGNDHKSG